MKWREALAEAARFFRVSAGTAFLALARIAGSLAVTKGTAMIAGPAGVALLGAFQNFTGVVLALCSGGISSGIVQRTASTIDPAERAAVVTRLIRLTLWSTALTILATLLLSVWLAIEVLGDGTYLLVILVFCALAVGLSLNTALMHVLVGYGQKRQFLWANVLAAVLTVLVAFPMIRFLGMPGALLVAPLANGAVVVFSIRAVRRLGIPLWGSGSKLDLPFIRSLAGFPLMGLSSAALLPLAQLFVRERLGEASGIDAAGTWQAVVKVSDAYMMIVIYLVLMIALPRFSAAIAESRLLRKIATVAVSIAVATVCLAVPLYLLRDRVIVTLFSSEFMPMRELFAPQIIGDTLRSMVLVVQAAYASRVVTGAYVSVDVTLAGTFVALSAFWIPLHGALGVVFAWIAACALALLVSLALMRTLRPAKALLA